MGIRSPGRHGRPDRIFAAAFGLWLAVILLGAAACGKKAPPVAPQQEPLAAVDDLKGVLRQGNVELSWSHIPGNRGVRSYIVLQAREALSQQACPGCPLEFQKTGSVEVAESLRKEKHSLDYSESLTAGFRYSFSVRPVSGSGAQGPDSNLVVIEYP